MSIKEADIIIHSYGVRIARLLEEKEMSEKEIKMALPDIPSTTLSDHINKLVKKNILIVSKEIKVQGSVVKRMYKLSDPNHPYQQF